MLGGTVCEAREVEYSASDCMVRCVCSGTGRKRGDHPEQVRFIHRCEYDEKEVMPTSRGRALEDSTSAEFHKQTGKL